MRKIRQAWMVMAGLLAMGGGAQAYYHFIHYANRFPPYSPMPEKFNLEALPNGVLQVFLSGQGPVAMAPLDSFSGLASQVRLAVETWNSVGTSKLRLAYGGLSTSGTPANTPSVDVVFEEVPPGLVAMGGPTVWDERASDDGGYIPIRRSMVIVRNDLTQKPSYGESFFTTMVHELGHALGLQHALTSAAMSTDYTRATTRGRALAADDIAGLSLLYPAANFISSTGSISGRVTMDGQGVHLASVVALPPNGGPVSALTNPDGSYRIDGLAAGPYYVYVHPLPPTELASNGIRLPVDEDGQPVAAGDPFVSQFYPGTSDARQAVAMPVSAGAVLQGVDFAVQRRSYVPLYAVTTYSYPGQTAVKPAFISESMMLGGQRNFLVAGGAGLVSNAAPVAGLKVTVLGDAALVPEGGLSAYGPDPRYLRVDFQYGMVLSEGPRHLIFSIPGDMYVLPWGLTLAGKLPPSISAVTPAVEDNGRQVARLSGTNLSAATAVYFDGVRAPVLGWEEATNELVVAPPPAPGGHRAVVTAVNGDAQSSLFLQGGDPATYTYPDEAGPGSITMNPASLPAGAEAMVEIEGSGTHFENGYTVLGFGSPDVVVRRLWVISPTRILANVMVAAGAPQTLTQVSVTSGLETVSLPYGFQIKAANSEVPILSPTVTNAATGQALVCAGCVQLLQVRNFANLAATAGLAITVNGVPAALLSVSESQITFQTPEGLPVGPAVLKLESGSVAAQPVVVMIEPAPPVILASGGKAFVTPGDTVTLTLTGLDPAGAEILPSRITVSVGGVEHPALAVAAIPGQTGVYLVQFVLSEKVAPGEQIPLRVSFDGRISAPSTITVLAQTSENQ